jgi:hypothetical protein
MRICFSQNFTYSSSAKTKQLKELLNLDERVIYDFAEIEGLPRVGEPLKVWRLDANQLKPECFTSSKVCSVEKTDNPYNDGNESYLIRTNNSTYKVRFI